MTLVSIFYVDFLHNCLKFVTFEDYITHGHGHFMLHIGIGAGLESMTANLVGWEGSINPKVCYV